jgi:hypothetical protein
MMGVFRSMLADAARDGGFGLHSLIVPLGITTLVLIASTLSVGLFIRKKRRVLLPVHRTLAFLTLAGGLCRAIIVSLTL